VKNPWTDLPKTPPFVLPCDKDVVDKAKDWCAEQPAGKADKFGLQTQLKPLPYIGDPKAPILFLTLNPGYTAKRDEACEESEAFQECYAANLFHEPQKYPLYFLDPRLSRTPGGEYYRKKQFREPIESFGLELVAKAIFVVEFSPYHSVSYRHFGTMPSQAYSMTLVEAAIQRSALVLVHRKWGEIAKQFPHLRTYPNVLRPNSESSPAVSYGNYVEYRRIYDAINSTRGARTSVSSIANASGQISA
jgi:hypothetical protein